jgi:hypothetical protein
MSDDLAKQSIAELQDLVRCRCHPAYKDRGLHDPDCECDNAENVKVVADRIEELEAEVKRLEAQCDGLAQAAINNGQGLIIAEAKLAKAVGITEGLRDAWYTRDLVQSDFDHAVAELRGNKT